MQLGYFVKTTLFSIKKKSNKRQNIHMNYWSLIPRDNSRGSFETLCRNTGTRSVDIRHRRHPLYRGKRSKKLRWYWFQSLDRILIRISVEYDLSYDRFLFRSDTTISHGAYVYFTVKPWPQHYRRHAYIAIVSLFTVVWLLLVIKSLLSYYY